MDVGMCHEIESELLVSDIELQEEDAMEYVFSGRYQDYVRTLHTDLIGECSCVECREPDTDSKSFGVI